jgi:NADH-ubiquinone oxidoreductase chain 6|uniref:NADH dehydrogenase subunit 6 n=1 Tax=Rhizopus microsporus TaxID=58291 RepID=UPI002A7F3330|nr:NADH dehydrogenase subunit 6 [Rhizopus microsporus]WPA89444.1 NADH dehydrogenase subunit 6 [Rhizopus microsporus]
MNTILLDLLIFGSVLSGILVITSRNPVISVLFLISVFVNVACYLILLGINFIGLTYLIVYVGAIAILFLFVIMMLNIKLVELQDSSENYSNPYPLAFVLGTLFVSGLSLANKNISVASEQSLFVGSNKSEIKLDLPEIFDSINLLSFKSNTLETLTINHSNWDNVFVSMDQINSIGQVLYTSHSLFLIVASMILLLAMVGPITLCLNPTKRIN